MTKLTKLRDQGLVEFTTHSAVSVCQFPSIMHGREAVSGSDYNISPWNRDIRYVGTLTVHKLEQLVDHRLEELPVGLEEPRVLAHDVHDVGGDDGLVVLALLLLAQPQQVLDDRHQEPLLVLLVHRAGDGADGPAQRVEVLPRPLGAVNLKRKRTFLKSVLIKFKLFLTCP